MNRHRVDRFGLPYWRSGYDPMASHGTEETDGGVGHVAVHTPASLGFRCMMGMCASSFDVGRMTLCTCCIAPKSWLELVVGLVSVEFVTTHAGHVPLCVASRQRHPVVIPTGHPHGAVFPKG